MKYTLARIESHRTNVQRFLVKRPDGNIAGIIEKHRDTRCTRNPWKAFSGFGSTIEYLGCRYPLQWTAAGLEAAKAASIFMVVRTDRRKPYAAACPRCGGWTSFGGMSQHAGGPEGCDCREERGAK